MARFYAFVYFQAVRDLRLETRPIESQVHKVRDTLMSGALFPILSECGLRYGGTILNLPSKVASELHRAGGLRDTTTPLDRSDLILLATRPPLDDMREEIELRGKRRLIPSGHQIEKEVLRSMRGVFSRSDREAIRLADSVQLGENDWLREVHFHQSQGGSVRYYAVGTRRISPDSKNTTLGYLTAVPSPREGVPRVLAAFGPGGTSTPGEGDVGLRAAPARRGGRLMVTGGETAGDSGVTALMGSFGFGWGTILAVWGRRGGPVTNPSTSPKGTCGQPRCPRRET